MKFLLMSQELYTLRFKIIRKRKTSILALAVCSSSLSCADDMKKRPQEEQKTLSSGHCAKATRNVGGHLPHAGDNLCVAGLCSLWECVALKDAGTHIGSANLFITLVAPTPGFLPCSGRILFICLSNIFLKGFDHLCIFYQSSKKFPDRL